MTDLLDPILSDVRVDLKEIAALVEPGSRVLDIGCGDGDLLELLTRTRDVDGRGIELSQRGVNDAVARGLSVIQGDADSDLYQYPDQSFDYVILSQTIQATRNTKLVLQEMLRIGRRVIVSLPNFGHYDVRLQLMLRGRMPVSKRLPYSWYDTPNIHFCTIRDFVELSQEVGATVEKALAFNGAAKKLPFNAPWWVWNLIATQAVFLLSGR
ncbi:methionine biosynthesis protein MetW [Oryzibacter oryziterrae]|uniref:methionine biosynthesis protein MetW n=1 Tax=Oryzibacter oryziterrae TaxID=2766474 RepID=UPI001F00FEC0|nr:methionine biosynthesis protein MetW [Oryzibacter oryziterrae]